MKYCELTTLTHPLAEKYPGEVELIKQIFLSEGCKSCTFEAEKALNLDKIEVKRSKGQSRRATVDIAIGLSREQKNPQILLVELKFEIKRPANLSKKEIEDKIRHSIELISQEIPIHESKILLFNEKIIHEARSRVSRLFLNSPKIQVKTSSEFKEEYF